MNLINHDWLPVLDAGCFRQIGLRELLCTDGDFRLALPRDDMELSGLALAIALTQTLFLPADVTEWRKRQKVPLTDTEYATGIEPFRDWFNLDDARQPFMQTRGVKAAEITPMQKLFIGLPDGVSHTFFNAEGEISAVCGGCAAIALFHQASVCPSFGGGFKGSLRGAAPVTTFVDVPDRGPGSLRRRIWRNVLPAPEVARLLPGAPTGRDDLPVWILPVTAGSTVRAGSIGLRRGLFWQPAHVELRPAAAGDCEHCGASGVARYGGFLKEKFVYTLDGMWPHPHSPRQWTVKKGEREERFLSFTTTAPAWTQLSQYVFRQEAAREGHAPASIVTAWTSSGSSNAQELNLLIGGYRNNQANVIERRYELFSFAPGWEDAQAQIEACIGDALAVRTALRGSLYWAAKGQKDHFKGLGVAVHEISDARFLTRSGTLLLTELREIDWAREDWITRLETYREALIALAETIFAEVVAPYRHDPELIHAIAAARSKLARDLKPLRPTQTEEVDPA